MSERGYSVTVAEFSKGDNTEPTKRELVQLKNAEFEKLDAVVNENDKLVLTPVGYAVLQIHNELTKQGNKDYKVFVIMCEEGVYSTSSENFFDTFHDIYVDMIGEPDFKIAVYKRASKNFQGKYFLTCGLA